MKRGELYKVNKNVDNDPKKQRVFLIVSRQELIDKNFSTVICAPIYSNYGGLQTQVEVGADEGLKHDSTVFCDALMSIQKSLLTNYIGQLSAVKMQEVNIALRTALATG
ncbi:MAG: type II toxin-antitoxin system PemK/MazF family toxin [Treponema sp.]|nr:type II toxin-antitoxin system PemK/MazF family toxin [Treponema sp.]